jgi:hypothetical protein
MRSTTPSGQAPAPPLQLPRATGSMLPVKSQKRANEGAHLVVIVLSHFLWYSSSRCRRGEKIPPTRPSNQKAISDTGRLYTAWSSSLQYLRLRRRYFGRIVAHVSLWENGGSFAVCKRIRISPKPKHAIAESDVAAMTRPTVVNNDDIIKAKEGSTRWNETARSCTLKAHELKSRDARRQHLRIGVWWKWPLEDSPQMIGISARRSWRHAPHVPHPVLPGAMVAHQTALLSISLIL